MNQMKDRLKAKPKQSNNTSTVNVVVPEVKIDSPVNVDLGQLERSVLTVVQQQTVALKQISQGIDEIKKFVEKFEFTVKELNREAPKQVPRGDYHVSFEEGADGKPTGMRIRRGSQTH